VRQRGLVAPSHDSGQGSSSSSGGY
jgi:hypothetical protein